MTKFIFGQDSCIHFIIHSWYFIFIYAITKYNKSIKYPLTKSYQRAISAYPIPVTFACVQVPYQWTNTDDNMTYYFNLYARIGGPRFNESYMVNASDITSLITDKYQVISGHITRDYTSNLSCILVIPPNDAIISPNKDIDIVYGLGYTLVYYYWSSTYMKPDAWLLKNFIILPSYIAKQQDNILYYTVSY